MKKAILAVGVVAVAALVMVLFLPALLPGSGMVADLGVTLYDEDGNEVGSLAFVRQGSKVTKLTISLSYVVTSTSERFEEYLGVAGDVIISWAVGTPQAEYQTAATHTILEARTASNQYSWEHQLLDIISVDATGKYYGWSIQITASLIAETHMEDGETVRSDPWTETVYIGLSWEDEALTINGVVGG